MNRYSLLEARSGEPDSLLDDTDDDDPPLDPNPPREDRLAFSDDEMDDPLSKFQSSIFVYKETYFTRYVQCTGSPHDLKHFFSMQVPI